MSLNFSQRLEVFLQYLVFGIFILAQIGNVLFSFWVGEKYGLWIGIGCFVVMLLVSFYALLKVSLGFLTGRGK